MTINIVIMLLGNTEKIALNNACEPKLFYAPDFSLVNLFLVDSTESCKEWNQLQEELSAQIS